jgi:hypothetical protein
MTLQLKNLKNGESIEIRLSNLEEIIRLSELFEFNETILNVLLLCSRDLFRPLVASLHHRKKAFEYIAFLIQKHVCIFFFLPKAYSIDKRIYMILFLSRHRNLTHFY